MRPVLILGGGINGCALARELVLNGVPVSLVDTADVAFGATAYSSRLIHGGLRYLEYGEFDLVRESLAERARLLHLAPQFVRPLQLFIPTGNRFGGFTTAISRFLGDPWWWPLKAASSRERGSLLIRAGLRFYDLYAHDQTLPRHGVIAADAAGAIPVDCAKYRWLCSYYDAQVVFPERMVLAMLADARQASHERGVEFQVLTYHEARLHGRTVEITPVSDPATVVRSFEPAAIVNATGAWVDLTLKRLAVPSRTLMGGTKGSHLFTFHAGLRQALAGRGLYAEAADGRPVFITPLAGATLIGTTDLPYSGDPVNAVANDAEINYLLETVNAILPEIKLERGDVAFHYSGVRPLPYVDATTPAAVTRRHWLEKHADAPLPLYSIIGGKLTTCRSLAEEAAKTILGQLNAPVSSNTRDRVLPGGENYPADLAATISAIARRLNVPVAQIEAAWPLLGTRTEAVLSSLALSPDDVVPGVNLPRALVRHIIREEWATTLDDLVERRLMLLYHQRLSRAALECLAGELVAEGRLLAVKVKCEVGGTVERLREHFGKIVE